MSFHPQVVLFDLDGTLLDTAPDLALAANALLLELGRAPVTQADIRRWIGRGIAHLVQQMLSADEENPSPALLSAAVTAFKRYYAQCNGFAAQAYAGVIEGLNAFQSAGCPMAVVTNKADAFVAPLLERTGLAHYFAVTLGGEKLPRAKPDPMPLTWLCGRLNALPTEALLIGDSLVDAAAARAAGARVFLVPYGYNEGRAPLPGDCDAIVESVFHAYQLLFAP